MNNTRQKLVNIKPISLISSWKVKLLSVIIGPTLLSLNAAVIAGVAIKNSEIDRSRALEKANIETHTIQTKEIDRVKTLEDFFSKYNSPLKEHSSTFVSVADKYNMDYRLLPAISCIESGCGKKLIPDSYNPFGWGIYGNNVLKFRSYDEAIEVVGKGIKNNYIEKGLDTPEKIAPVYTPPAHKHWLGSVRFFIKEINTIESSESREEAKEI